MEVGKAIIENERLIKILELIIQQLINRGKIPCKETGICQIFTILLNEEVITTAEYMIGKMFINNNKPTKENEYKEFTNNEFFINNCSTDDNYFWNTIEYFPQTRQIRIDYLTKLISNIK